MADEITLEDVKRLRLEPGDVLAVRLPKGATFEAFSHVQEVLAERFGAKAVLLHDETTELTVISGIGS